MDYVESKVSYEVDDTVDIPVKVKPKNDDKTVATSSGQIALFKNERFWATLVHAIGPLMIGLFFFGEGPAWFGLLAITAGIYLYYSDKSPYIKFHARQALAMQTLGTVAWMALIIGTVPIWLILIVVSAILMIVLVGFLLLPLALVSWPALLLASFALPLSTAILGAMGAWETWHGRDFKYPRLADWLDKRFGVCYRLV